MASSSCRLDLRATAAAGKLPLSMQKKQGGPSLCYCIGGQLTSRRRMCAKATLTASGRGASTEGMMAGCLLSEKREISVSKRPPGFESAAAVYANKTVEEERARATAEKLERWIRDSIGEIVRNIENAPFLVHIFSYCGGATGLRLVKEAASPEIWRRIRRRWQRESQTPDAVILVERLENEEEELGGEKEERAAADCGVHETWGLVVQGCGMDCPSCYILSTSRVKSAAGLCIYFCLVRAKCFGDPADVQLRNAWLQR